MEDQRFTIYNEGDVYLGGKIDNGELAIISEVDAPYESEYGYNLTKEDTDKLFKLISLNDFIKLCKVGGCIAMEEFFKKNNIQYQGHLIY